MASVNKLSPIPHPPKKPVVGNMLSLDSTAPVQDLVRLAKELGPIFWLDMMGAPLVIVSGHDLVEELSDEKRFDKAVRGSLRRVRAVGGDGLVHRRHQRAELEQGAQHPDDAVRQSRDAVLSPEHARYRRAAGREVGTVERRRRDRRRPRHDRADAGHHRPVRVRLSFQFLLSRGLPSVCRVAGALARNHHDDARNSARGPVAAEAPRRSGRRRRLHEQDGRRDHRRAAQERRSRRGQEGHARRHDDRRRPRHRHPARRRQHPLPDQYVFDRGPRDHQRPVVVHALCAAETSRGAEESL